jgi:hypothetical protein
MRSHRSEIELLRRIRPSARGAAKRFVSVLMAVLISPAALNGETDGPIARAIAREAARAARESALTLDKSSAHPAAASHPDLQDWSNVRQIIHASEIIVRVKVGGIVRGRFVSADDSGLLLTDDAGRTERIARADVVEVEVIPNKTFDSIARKAAPYALIGMAVGVGAAVGYCHSNDCQGQGILTGAVFLMLGALVGEGVGVVIAVSGNNGKVIYRAP